MALYSLYLKDPCHSCLLVVSVSISGCTLLQNPDNAAALVFPVERIVGLVVVNAATCSSAVLMYDGRITMRSRSPIHVTVYNHKT